MRKFINILKVIFATFFILISIQGSKASQIDSLEKQLNSTLGSERVALFNKLADSYLRLSVGKTIEYAYLALQLSQQNHDTIGEAWALYHLARANSELYNYDISVEYLKRGTRVFTNANNNEGMVRSIALMANLKYLLGDEEDSEIHFKRAIAIARNNTSAQGYAHRLLGEFLQNKDKEKALKQFEKAYVIHTNIGDKEEIIFDCYSLHRIYRKKNQVSKAIEYLEIASKLASELKSDHEKIFIEYSLGACFTQNGDYNRALKLQKSALDKALKQENWPRTIDCYLLLSETYSKQKKYDKAYNYFRQHISLKDSLITEENANRIDQLSLTYEADYKEQQYEQKLERIKWEKELHELEKEKQVSESKRQKMLIGFFISIALFLLITSLLIYTRLLHRKNSEARLKQLVNATFEGILIIDNHKIQETNQKITSLSGYHEKELIDKSVTLLFEPKYSAEVANLYLDNEEKYESRMIRNNGQSYDIEVLEKPLFYKGRNVRVVAIRDISERKKTEMALVNSEQQLIKLNAMKDKLFSIIGHDLKGTFWNFKVMFETFAEDLFTFEKNQLDEILHTLRDSSNATYNLLENLLNWAKIQRGQMIFNPKFHSFKKIVDDNIKLLTPNAITKKIHLKSEIKDEFKVYIDKEMISTVCRNLIANAIKFTQEGGTVWVSSLENGGIVEVTVADTGIGIPRENMKKIFAPDEHFTTFGTRQEKGSGLGLILCKEFVEQNGGKIWVESDYGVGSRFKFTLYEQKRGESNVPVSQNMARAEI